MRIGPRDPTTHAPKVGLKNEVVRQDRSMASLQPRILKVFKSLCKLTQDRTGFSGGFKIPEEYRKSKIKKMGLGLDND